MYYLLKIIKCEGLLERKKPHFFVGDFVVSKKDTNHLLETYGSTALVNLDIIECY